MSSNYGDGDDGRTKAYQKQLEMAFHNLVAAQEDATQDQLTGGGVSDQALIGLERSVVTMQRLLRPFITSPDLQDVWQQHDLDAVPQICGQRVVTEHGDGDFGMAAGDEVSVRHAPMWKLDEWGDVLIHIYTELGFAPDIEIEDYTASGEEAV